MLCSVARALVGTRPRATDRNDSSSCLVDPAALDAALLVLLGTAAHFGRRVLGLVLVALLSATALAAHRWGPAIPLFAIHCGPRCGTGADLLFKMLGGIALIMAAVLALSFTRHRRAALLGAGALGGLLLRLTLATWVS